MPRSWVPQEITPVQIATTGNRLMRHAPCAAFLTSQTGLCSGCACAHGLVSFRLLFGKAPIACHRTLLPKNRSSLALGGWDDRPVPSSACLPRCACIMRRTDPCTVIVYESAHAMHTIFSKFLDDRPCFSCSWAGCPASGPNRSRARSIRHTRTRRSRRCSRSTAPWSRTSPCCRIRRRWRAWAGSWSR